MVSFFNCYIRISCMVLLFVCSFSNAVSHGDDNNDKLSEVSLSIDIINWVLSTFIFLGIEGYWLYQMVKTSDSIIIRKRKPGILLISICSLLIYIVMNSTMAMLNGQHVIDFDADLITQIIIVIIACIALPLWYIYIYFSCIRYWLLFYSINWSICCAKNKWCTIITPCDHNKDWYLLNQTKYGSWNWIKKRLFYVVLCCCIYSIMSLTFITVYDLSIIAIILLLSLHLILTAFGPLIICISIQCKIPAFDDNIGLREELKFCNFLFVIVLFICFIYQIIYISNRDIFEHNDSFTNIFWASWFFLLRIGLFLINLKQTRWPLKKFESVLKSYSHRTVLDLAHQKTTAQIAIDEQKQLQQQQGQSMSPTATSPSLSNSIRLQMRNALRDNRIFSQFMLILLKEHCAECLLSIIEFLQFHENCYKDGMYYKNHQNKLNNKSVEMQYDEDGDIGKAVITINESNDEIEEIEKIERLQDDENESVVQKLREMYPRIPSNISNKIFIELPISDDFPKSSIVFKPQHKRCYDMKFTIKDYKIIGRELWKKYIRQSTELEININSIKRCFYKKIFENQDEWMKNKKYDDFNNLCAVFNPCIEQMAGLITASFVHWRDSTEYARLQKQILGS